MWPWLRSLWTDETRFGATMTVVFGVAGTVLTSTALAARVSEEWGVVGIVCQTFAMYLGYRTPRP